MPAVVGTPIEGSIGLVGLAEALVIGHLAAVGEQEVDPLGAVHRTAAADGHDEIDVERPGEWTPASDLLVGRVLLDLVEEKTSTPAFASVSGRLRMPGASSPGSVTSKARGPPSSPTSSPSRDRLPAPKITRLSGEKSNGVKFSFDLGRGRAPPVGNSSSCHHGDLFYTAGRSGASRRRAVIS